MKQHYSLLLFFALFTSAHLAAQPGKIKGAITTADGKPARYITVSIDGTWQQSSSDEEGAYEIKNIRPGTRTLVITAAETAAQRRTITVGANETRIENFIIKETSRQLDAVFVNAHKGTEHASVSLRLKTPLLETPQNIQVVDQAALVQQQVISMSDGLVRNVSGATRVEHWGDLYANITARGSQIQAFRNGFNVVASYWGPLTEDMSFVDRVEFVKGPAGFMLANGDPSGLYNIVTKKPTGITKGAVNLTLGSFDLYRGSLDLDGSLSKDKKLLYRLNIAAQHKGSHRDFEYNNRYVIAPVLSYQVDDKTKLTLEYNGQFAKMTEVGSYYVFSKFGYGTYPVNFTLTNPGLPPTKINDQSAYLTFEHAFNTNWKLTAQGAYFNYNQAGMSSWPSMMDSTNGHLVRNIGLWDAKSNMVLGQVFLNGEFRTGSVRHRILAGVDAADKKYYADWGQSHDLDSVGALFDPRNPDYGVPANGYPVFDRSRPIEERAIAAGGIQTQRYSSVYVQDELAFFRDRLRLTLAGRYTDVSQIYGTGTDFSTAKHLTPRTGLSYSIGKTLSVYGLYDQAFIPQTGTLTGGGKIKPVTGNNMELGIKKNWFHNRWLTTLSVYRILKQNELTADPDAPNPNQPTSIVLGEKVARGVELDVRGTILPGFTATANYAFTEGLITKVAPGAAGIYAVGEIVPGYAKHTSNAWLSYELQKGALQGLGISGGFTSLIGRHTGWSTRGQQLPDYFKLDGGLFYTQDRYRFTLNVFNMLNSYLYTGSYYDLPSVYGDWSSVKPAYYYQTEPPRNIRFSVSYRF
ncbi:TonB-dependent siderophore receptor [Niabella drilacis]|uniref:Iron complex outermembrane recepter protein n=1 Tax=Niabella drilacis (strain DSM 25811 / CCM 8410 / CCUG 62505 / LMG 26954 / E90) TaxID=1285928 RepID=A0A1G6J533_NIADE|nr:TonB-dependent siderophore receptor [Niabella drilacis]SDC13739.1 iron complex outermembrane recepter protein [Niabella drilacis]